MKIREIMTTNIQVAEPDDTLDDIAAMMRDQDVGSIPIVEDDELIGIITDRDIVVRCVAEGKDPAEIAADEVISGELETIDPDADVEQARRTMSTKQIRRLPVMEHGRLVGMVSLGDLAVKTDQETEVAETLEDISDGVKASGAGEIGGRKLPKPAAENKRKSQPARATSGGRQDTMERSGRQQASPRSRIEEQDRGIVDRQQKAEHGVQGIASRGADEEVQRQNRVVPIRTGQKSNLRGEKKGKPSGRKAG